MDTFSPTAVLDMLTAHPTEEEAAAYYAELTPEQQEATLALALELLRQNPTPEQQKALVSLAKAKAAQVAPSLFSNHVAAIFLAILVDLFAEVPGDWAIEQNGEDYGLYYTASGEAPRLIGRFWPLREMVAAWVEIAVLETLANEFGGTGFIPPAYQGGRPHRALRLEKTLRPLLRLTREIRREDALKKRDAALAKGDEEEAAQQARIASWHRPNTRFLVGENPVPLTSSCP